MYFALKDKETTYIAISGIDYFPIRMAKDLMEPDNDYAWKVKGKKGVMMLSECFNIVADIMRYDAHLYKGDLSCETIMKDVVPKLQKHSKQYGLSYKGVLSSDFALADKDNLFVIDSTGGVIKRDYCTDSATLHGCYVASEVENTVDRIIDAFHAYDRLERENSFPICIYDVRTCKRKMYEE